MKKSLFILSLLCSLMANAQVMPTYTPQSYDSYARPFQEYARAFRQAEAQINDLTNIVINALAENIDEAARRDFNSDYDRLQSLSENLHKNGLSQGIWSGINSVRTSINNHIVSYNERARRQEAIEEARQQEEARKRQKEQEQAEEAKRKAGWSGSGFALAQGHIVTNYHVIENAKTILVKGIKGDFVTEYRASVVATDKINDIAIIKISDDRFKGFGATPYKIKRAMSDVGESVWALGYPMVGVMGDEVKFTDGKISARTGIQGDMSVYQISVPIQPGNSGGPLFDNNGNIVGITSSGLNREAFNSENVNYAIKTSYLYNLIESSMSASILPQGTAMQGQSLTEKIKLAKKFVYIILCSEDPNFHNEILPAQNKEAKHATIKVLPPSNASSTSPTSKSGNGEKDKNTMEKGEIIQTAPITQKSKPTIELDKHSHDFGSFLECDGPVETTFRITNTGESQLVLYTVSPSSESVTAVPSDCFIAAGKSGVINVTYHPELRPGKFSKTITIKSNASDSVAKIYIKGEVIGRKIIRIDEKGDSTMVLGGSMYPKFGGRLAISKIILTPDSTILDCSYTSGSLSIDRKTYLKTSNGRKYKLKSVKNIPYNPDFRKVPSGQHESFSLCFSRIPESIDKFDLIEDAKPGWHVENIELKQASSNQTVKPSKRPQREKKLNENKKSKNDIIATDNSSYVSGMSYITTITKTSGWGEAASELGVQSAINMLKKEAAKRDCDVVLITNIYRGFTTSVTGKLFKRQ